jgi:hypothetical protein
VSFLLWLSMTALAGGATVGGHFQPARIFFTFIFLVQLARGGVVVAATPVQRSLVAIGALLVGWGFVSLFWTPDPVRGAAEVLVVGLGFIMMATIVSVVREQPRAVNAMRRGWVSAFVLTLPIAVWELATNQHLASAIGQFQAAGDLTTGFFYTGVTFGNRNDYSTFIVFVFPFLLWSFSRTRALLLRLGYSALIASAAFIVAVNGSRLGLVALAIEVTAVMVFRLTARRGLAAQAILALLLAVTIVGAFRFQPAALGRFRALQEGLGGQSTAVRVALAMNGIELIERTGGIGVGAGGFERAVLSSGEMRSANGMSNAHNLWIEVSAQYGVIVGLGFACWVLFLLAALVRATRSRLVALTSRELAIGVPYGAALLAGVVPAGLMGSSVLEWAMLWAAIGSAAALADATYSTREAR